MTIGERIKRKRMDRGLLVEEVARKLDISPSTLYRYENSSISKIPIEIIDKLCSIYHVSARDLMGNCEQTAPEELPASFENAEQAMAFMLKMPVLAAYGGYDIESMDEKTIVEFANEILSQLKLVSYKYKK